MRIGMAINYAGGFRETAAELADFEKAGLDIVFVPEAYSYDAVSQLGYLAAVTERVELASGIMQLYSRTPTLTAMTAAGLDYISDGRFSLGLGASGPQVIEGWHGVPYDAPVGRTRETIEICRAVWRRDRLEYDGQYYQIPLPAGQGTGLGKPLKLINHPVRDRIPIILAALGPKNVEMAAELAEGWEPIFYYPEKAKDVWGAALAAGKAKRDPSLPPLDVFAQTALAIGDDVKGLIDADPAGAGAVHRRHGRAGPELLQQPGGPVRLRQGSGRDPGRLPGGAQGRGGRADPAGAARARLAHRAEVLRGRAPGRAQGIRRHDAERGADGADARRAGRASSSRSRSWPAEGTDGGRRAARDTEEHALSRGGRREHGLPGRCGGAAAGTPSASTKSGARCHAHDAPGQPAAPKCSSSAAGSPECRRCRCWADRTRG